MISKLNPEQIARYVYDEETQAQRTVLVSTDIAIELNADDGDSVEVRAMTLTLEAGIHSVAGMKVACLYGTGSVFVSPSDQGDDFHQLVVAELSPIKICAKRIKIVGDNCKVVVQG